jgi:peroxiredoxin Q/BCP
MRTLLCAAAVAVCLPLRAAAADLEVGHPAPVFEAADQTGKQYKLADYRGRTVVLAFYPADFTSGCTCEVQALRDTMAKFQKQKVAVFGISTDTVESHRKFADKERLNFPLLADPDKKITEAYGVLNAMRGRADRVTFIIGPDGILRGIDRDVNGQFQREGTKLTTRHAENLAKLVEPWTAKLGAVLPNFQLAGTDGRTLSLLTKGKKATVVLIISANCAVSRAYDRRMSEIAADPAFREIAFLGLYPNVNEPVEQIKRHGADRGLAFPLAKDVFGYCTENFKAEVTPTVWVVDPEGKVVYTGSIDDNRSVDQVKRHYLRDALTAVLAGRPVAVAETKAFGCAVVK